MMNIVLVLGWGLKILKFFNNSTVLRHAGVQILLPEVPDSLLWERSSSGHCCFTVRQKHFGQKYGSFYQTPSFPFMNIKEFRCSYSFAYSFK